MEVLVVVSIIFVGLIHYMYSLHRKQKAVISDLKYKCDTLSMMYDMAEHRIDLEKKISNNLRKQIVNLEKDKK